MYVYEHMFILCYYNYTTLSFSHIQPGNIVSVMFDITLQITAKEPPPPPKKK